MLNTFFNMQSKLDLDKREDSINNRECFSLKITTIIAVATGFISSNVLHLFNWLILFKNICQIETVRRNS